MWLKSRALGYRRPREPPNLLMLVQTSIFGRVTDPPTWTGSAKVVRRLTFPSSLEVSYRSIIAKSRRS